MLPLKKPLITSSTDWTEPLLQEVWSHIERVARDLLEVDYYPAQIEIISAEQMVDAYASVALPVNYSHWSFGKQFLQDWEAYCNGEQGLAYEIVLNSDPCISYLMEENSALMQALVLAHAAVGHSHVYKNNYMFADAGLAGSIIDYMVFAKNFIADCEEKYGVEEVEKVLDAAHSLATHGFDKQRRKHKKKLTEEDALFAMYQAEEEARADFDLIIAKTTFLPEELATDDDERPAEYGEENLLYFIYKNAPGMPVWKKEILRIVTKVRQYFYPQMKAQIVHEGFATFTHYMIMNQLEEDGVISSDAQLSWLASHSNVLYQSTMKDRHYNGRFNPYYLGFNIFMDIKRICENPTEEDREWFSFAGGRWQDVVKEAVRDYNNESFILQFLSPHLMRKWKMMLAETNSNTPNTAVVTEVCDDAGYRAIRSKLAGQYSMIEMIPEIIVKSADLSDSRKLTLEYKPYRDRVLYEEYALKTLEYIRYLWGYPVELIIPTDQKVQARSHYWDSQMIYSD